MTTIFNPTVESTIGSTGRLMWLSGSDPGRAARARHTKARGARGDDRRDCARFQESPGGNRIGVWGWPKRASEQPEKVRVYIAAARQGIDRGVKLTSQLLAFAKRQELEARPGDVNELLRNLDLLLKYSAGPGIRIVLELASDIPNCLIDPSQFDAAVLNLVVNARDAMPHGGEVRISTERWVAETAISGSPAPGAYVRVCVKDSGQGIPAEVVRKVFDPFFTTKGEKGNGLGLPHVYAFMRRVGGHVSVTSEWGRGHDLRSPVSLGRARRARRTPPR